ncbi:MAG: S8 family serine peptidase [Pseudomonadota bacterium]|nr:S8 family serine peptidase [Pseudomonadota bacterium]
MSDRVLMVGMWASNFLFVGTLFLTLSVCATSSAQQFVPGEIIIKLKSSDKKSAPSASSFMNKAGIAGKLQLKGSWTSMKLHHFKVNNSQSVEQTIADMKNDPEVEYAEPNYLFGKQNIDNPGHDEVYDAEAVAQGTVSGQSGGGVVTTAPIRYQDSWSLMGATGSEPIVAVIDTGVDYNHPAFAQSGAIWTNPNEIAGNGIDDDGNGYVDDIRGWNFAYGNNNPLDDDGHGTHVAGTILGMTKDIFNTPFGAAKIQIMALKFLDASGYGATSAAVQAIYYAVNNGAKILNNSWGGSGYSQALKDAIAYAYTKKALFVAAAGNAAGNNDVSPMYPASYDVPNIISTAATTPSDGWAYFSNYGTATVHMGSPGSSVFSTWPGGTYKYSDGTSMATPIISGIASLMLHENSALSGYQIKTFILGSGEIKSVLTGKVSTKARVNAYNSVLSAQLGEPAVDPSYQSINPLASRDVASTVAGGGCGLVGKSDGGRGGPWSVTHTLLLLLIAVPALISIVLKKKNPMDLRKFDRFKIASAVTLNVEGKEFVGEVSSISLGGVKVDTEALIRDGGIISMSISSPDGKNRVDVQGKVVWSEAQKHYGVQFANADTSVLSTISQWTKALAKIS